MYLKQVYFLMWFLHGKQYVIRLFKKIYFYFTAAGDPNAWRLGRIEETDHETPV